MKLNKLSYPVYDNSVIALQTRAELGFEVIRKFTNPDISNFLILGTGSSGSVIMAHMAMYYNQYYGKEWMRSHLVRKPTEERHSHYGYSVGSTSADHIFIVDDFICTGKTIYRILEFCKEKRVINKVKAVIAAGARCKADKFKDFFREDHFKTILFCT